MPIFMGRLIIFWLVIVVGYRKQTALWKVNAIRGIPDRATNSITKSINGASALYSGTVYVIISIYKLIYYIDVL